MDLLGQTLEGGYRPERLIAEGRNSQVYEADSRGSRVAIKLLHPVLADDVRQARRFAHEGDVLRRLRHRHAVELLESRQGDGGYWYHVLELLEGMTLRRRLDGHGSLQPSGVARLIRQAAGALQALHDLGVVHRAVEPNNLFLDVRGGDAVELKLLDLGKSLDAGQAERDHEVVGTRGYMAPEQLRGEVHETTAAADLFALAVVAYEALCGGLPFEGEDDQDLLYEITGGSFPPASGRVEGLSPEVDAVLSRALSPAPDQRHHSIETFADELADALTPARPEKRVGSDTARMKAVPAPDLAPEPEAVAGARVPAPAPVEPPTQAASPAPARPAGPPVPRVPVAPVPEVIPGLPLVDPMAEPPPEQAPPSPEQAPPAEDGFVEQKTMVDNAPPDMELPLPAPEVIAPRPVAPPTEDSTPQQAPDPVPSPPLKPEPTPQLPSEPASPRETEPLPPLDPEPTPPKAPAPVAPQAPEPVAPQALEPAPQAVQPAPPAKVTPHVPAEGATPYVPPAVPSAPGAAPSPPPAAPAAPVPGPHVAPVMITAPPKKTSVAIIVVPIVFGLVGLGLLLGLYFFLR